MNAVVVTGGSGPSLTDIKKLLDECDFLVAADSGLGKLKAWGRVPHLFVGDGDSLAPDLREDALAAGWIPVPRDKDYTDTELALQACEARGAQTIHLVGGGEGRMDHLLANLMLFKKFPKLLFWTTSRETCRVLEKGFFRSVHARNTILSVYPLEGAGVLETKGLVWELDTVDFSLLMSLSNRPVDQSVEWTVKSGRFLVMESHE